MGDDLRDSITKYDDEIQSYIDLMVENAEKFYTIRTGNAEEIRDMFKRKKQTSMSGTFGFGYTAAMVNLVSTRFYVNEIDITLAMREKIYKDRYHKGKENSQKLVDSIVLYENRLFEEFIEYCVNGNTPEYEEHGFIDYIDLARKVNGYIGEIGSTQAFSDNVTAFRKLVKEFVNARKKCGLCATFTSTYVSETRKPWLNKEVITYDEALEIAEEIIDNYICLRYGEEEIDEESLVDELCLEETPLKDEIQEKFITNFIEQCGLNREMYKTYMSGSVYVPNKKLLIALGLFCEPWCDIENRGNRDLVMTANLEKFLNQNSFSIKSLFGTVSEYDNMLDNELLYLIEDGLNLDMLAYMLKHFAKTGKDIKKSKSE